MTPNAIEIQGTLREDGTLLLDQNPNLPPGRVRVIVQPILDYKQTDIWQFFQRIQTEQEESAIPPTSQEVIDAYLATMRDDDDRCQLTEQVQEECQRQRGQETE